MSFRRLRVENFQSHRKFSVKFSPGVTCLVGPSDSGKSAVLRALYFACRNRPSGDAFVAHGQSSCKVTLEFDEHVLVRTKGKSNKYTLDGKEFSAFGSGVPEEILAALSLDEVNFQKQLDPPFWLGDSPGEVARELNRVVDLGLIDEALANAASQVRKAKSVVEVTEERLSQAKSRADSLAFTESFSEAVDEAAALEEKLDGLKDRRKRLADCLEEIGRLRQVANRAAPDPSRAAATAGRLREAATKRDSLCELLSLIRSSEGRRRRTEREAAAAQKELAALSPLCPTCKRPIG